MTTRDAPQVGLALGAMVGLLLGLWYRLDHYIARHRHLEAVDVELRGIRRAQADLRGELAGLKLAEDLRKERR